MASNTKKNRSQSNNTSKSSTSRKKSTGTSGNGRASLKNSSSKKSSTTRKNTASSSSQGGSSGSSSARTSKAQSNPLRDEIVLLLAFACTIILLLSNFNLAGTVGQSVKWVMFGLFGIAAYIIPFIIAGSILFMLANKDIIGVMRIKAIAVYALSVIASAVWQRITNIPDVKDSVGSYFSYCSEHKTGGGFFGGILCKILSPLGVAGTMVILIILAIICIILITEKSFIGGLRNSGHRIVKEAREDYSAYREHSSMSLKENGISDEEYRAMREEERHQARIRRLEKKEQAIAAKKAKEEAMAGARMNNIVRGVTKDLTIQDRQQDEDIQDIDIHEIEPVRNDVDVYMDDIYDPLIIPRKHINTDEDYENGSSYDEDDSSNSDIGDNINMNNDEITDNVNMLYGKVIGDKVMDDDINNINNINNINMHNADITDDDYIRTDTDMDSDAGMNRNDVDVTDSDIWEIHSKRQSGNGENSEEYGKRDDDIEPDCNDDNDYDKTYEEAISTNEYYPKNDGLDDYEDRGNEKKPNEENTEDRSGVLENEQSQSAHKREYKFPPVSLLNRNTQSSSSNLERENRNTAITLKQTLQNFGVKVDITDISCGPAVTRYELKPELGVKVSKIVSLADDIKLSLAAADIRIEAPIPGKSAIGIEVPNKEAGSVFLRELIENEAFKNNTSKIAFAAGKDIAGKTIVADIAKMPHLLIAGATGSGKSVCINTIIMSILYKARPDEVKMIMVDPKVVELSTYNGIPHLLLPVVTDPKKAAGALNWAVNEMNKRYKLFADMGVRNLKGYNDAVEKMDVKEGDVPVEKLPQIVIIVDELADLMMVAPGEVEDAICRLAQLARAAGIHMVIATQRPSVNVITGLIKANVPSRIAFSVSSGVDSRTILDMNGAEKLLGKGDMLYFPSNIPKPIRVQGAFVSDEEVSRVVDFLKENMTEEAQYDESIADTVANKANSSQASDGQNDNDSLFEDAGRFVIEKEKGSIGMLQRQFKIGFNRAGRIMDQLAQAGVVGPEIGTKPRKVLMNQEEFESYINNN